MDGPLAGRGVDPLEEGLGAGLVVAVPLGPTTSQAPPKAVLPWPVVSPGLASWEKR
ncbi:hypothetical protein ACI2L1_38375 [Streptomyces sp. NPDC019531]|uniref:hypothetical protein n=1 Tax=Streptomyces sp. NPDC019531 TaxID=3365062 RepID=UPI00384FBB70